MATDDDPYDAPPDPGDAPDDDPYFQPSANDERIGFTIVAALEILIFALSIVGTLLHFKSATRFNQVAKFHMWHTIYCINIAVLRFLEARKLLKLQGQTCDDLALSQVWLWLPVNIPWAMAVYYFFSRFDRILTMERSTGRRGRLRKGVYATYICLTLVCSITIGAIFGTDRPVSKKCYDPLLVFSNTSISLIVLISVVEMLWLTTNFLRMFYVKGSKPTAKTHFKVACCMITTASTAVGFISMVWLTTLMNRPVSTLGWSWAQIEGYVIPSYFTLYLLWSRHNLGENVRVNDDDEDLEDDEDDDPYSTELSTFGQYNSNPFLSVKQTGVTTASRAAREVEQGLVRVLPLQSTFNLRALLSIPLKISIEEYLRPPESTPMVVRHFVSSIALPVAEGYLWHHYAETTRILERYRVRERSNSQTVDAIAMLEKQTQYNDLSKKLQDLKLEVQDWVAMLQQMVEVLPSEGVMTRDDVGIEAGWHTFKSSRAKKMAAVAMWPTNLQQSSAIMRVPSQRPLALSVLTYGAPSAHFFGYKHGGWMEAQKKLRGRGSTARPELMQSASGMKNAQADLKELRLKFDLSGRSAVCMSQALAAAVAATVSKLEECIAKGDGRLVRQWASIGLLVHEVSLLSTFGKESGMIGDMRMALETLNLTVQLERGSKSGGAGASESVFQVKGVRAVSESGDGNDDGDGDGEGDGGGGGENNENDDGKDRRGDAVNFKVVGKKVVTLEVRSDEVFGWLIQQVGRSRGRGEGGGGGGVEESKDEQRTSNTGTSLSIEVHPVLLTLGVNEMQTVANAAGDTSLQTDINRQGLQGLRRYMESFRGFLERERAGRAMASLYRSESMLDWGSDGLTAQRGGDDADEDDDAALLRLCSELLSSLEGLIDAEATLKQKDVDLLMKSCFAARAMNAARTTSCKSAKDRTSMFHTLELVRLAERRGMLATLRSMAAEHAEKASGWSGSKRAELGTVQNVLNLLRSANGVRLQNCKENIGKAVFSFNKVQVKTLPRELQPPPWSIDRWSSKHS